MVSNRGGMIAFVLAVGLAYALRPPRARSARLGVALVAVILAGILAVPVMQSVRISGNSRELTVEQIWDNVKSVVGQSDSNTLETTKTWRLTWWKKIIDDTVYGDKFWTGRGFGLNFADYDGFAVDDQGSLRSPHNATMTVLGRLGVPGLVLWLLLHAWWAFTMARAWSGRAPTRRDTWAAVFAFALCLWVALVVNASFEVYFEGPWAASGSGPSSARAWPPSRVFRTPPGPLRDARLRRGRAAAGRAAPARRRRADADPGRHRRDALDDGRSHDRRRTATDAGRRGPPVGRRPDAVGPPARPGRHRARRARVGPGEPARRRAGLDAAPGRRDTTDDRADRAAPHGGAPGSPRRAPACRSRRPAADGPRADRAAPPHGRALGDAPDGGRVAFFLTAFLLPDAPPPAMPTVYDTAASPLGPLLLTSDGEALTGVFMPDHRHGPRAGADWVRDAGPFEAVREQLAAYFAGERQAFDVAVRPAGTPFQQAVWARPARDPLWRDRDLRRARRAPRRPEPDARRRRGERAQPGLGRDPVPPRRRGGRGARGLRRRVGEQAPPARARVAPGIPLRLTTGAGGRTETAVHSASSLFALTPLFFPCAVSSSPSRS